MVFGAILLSSCTKDLDIDYENIEPIYVIEGDITDEPAKVKITQTRNMNDSVKGQGLPGAEVVLSDDSGKIEKLVYGNDGYYRSPSGWRGETFRKYTLNVKIGGKEFSATSTMQAPVSLESTKFIWMSAAGIRMMLLKFNIAYPEVTEGLSFTHFRLYKNGQFYRSETGKQMALSVKSGNGLLGCTTEKKMDEDKPEDADAILHDNDKVHFEVWTVDSNVYDYFFSLKVGKKDTTNPISNITGGALGYFSAHHVCSVDKVFFRKDVE